MHRIKMSGAPVFKGLSLPSAANKTDRGAAERQPFKSEGSAARARPHNKLFLHSHGSNPHTSSRIFDQFHKR